MHGRHAHMPPRARFLPRAARALLFLAVMASVPAGAGAKKSTLKVAVCEPTNEPFEIFHDDGSISGFDVDVWNGLYHQLKIKVQAEGDQFAKDIVGTEAPDLIRMSLQEIIDAAAAGDIDVGMCAIYITPSRLEYVSFLPPFLNSGLRSIVRAKAEDMSFREVLSSVVGEPDSYAIFALAMLVILSMAFAHVIWVLERKSGANLHPHYGRGIFDSFYFAFVTATTVGYGDMAPKTILGKLFTIAWMLTGMFWVGMFSAAITTALLDTRLGLSANEIQIKTVDDLAQYDVAVWFTLAATNLRRLVPGIRVKKYDSQTGAMEALLNKEVDVVVDDAWIATYASTTMDGFQGLVSPAGTVFSQMDVSFVLGVPKGSTVQDPHPLMYQMSQALVEYMRGTNRAEYEASTIKWFGRESEKAESNNARVSKGLASLNVPLIVFASFIALVWLVVILFSNRRAIARAQVRQLLLNALHLNPRYTLNEMRRASRALYSKMGGQTGENVTAAKVIDAMTEMGQKMSLPKLAYLIDRQDAETQGKPGRKFSGTSPISPTAAAANPRRMSLSSWTSEEGGPGPQLKLEDVISVEELTTVLELLARHETHHEDIGSLTLHVEDTRQELHEELQEMKQQISCLCSQVQLLVNMQEQALGISRAESDRQRYSSGASQRRAPLPLPQEPPSLPDGDMGHRIVTEGAPELPPKSGTRS